jgi:hypothetical protein
MDTFTFSPRGGSMNPHPSVVPRPPGEEGKPVRDLLQDIHSRSGISQTPRGIVNPKSVDQTAFIATVISVGVCACTLLAMVWETIDPTVGLKIMGSVLIILFALLIFRAVNRTFSE